MEGDAGRGESESVCRHISYSLVGRVKMMEAQAAEITREEFEQFSTGSFTFVQDFDVPKPFFHSQSNPRLPRLPNTI